MNRRASLPGADELFRATGDRGGAKPDATAARATTARGGAARTASPARTAGADPEEEAAAASGRIRHDQKITVYLTGQELVDIEQARLRLRAEFDIAVDRGRIVREAIAELLQQLEEIGPDSAIVRRLS